MVHRALAAAAALVAVAFALSTFERWLLRRRRHELAWSIALVLFALAAGGLGAGVGVGWSQPVFRWFYFFGAIANVPVLALGTVYLLRGPRRGDRWSAMVALGVAFAGGVVAVAPMTPIDPDALIPQGSDVFGVLPRVLAAVASAGGALVIFLGAAWSAVRFRRTARRMVVANVLIAAGTAILSASGLLNSVADEMTAFAVTLVAGVSVLFAGFLVATTATKPTAVGGATASPPARAAVPARS